MKTPSLFPSSGSFFEPILQRHVPARNGCALDRPVHLLSTLGRPMSEHRYCRVQPQELVIIHRRLPGTPTSFGCWGPGEIQRI